ncbi:MAG: Verru_Chthon cassette protein D [Blastochloris sp.]|nr:Verru_Chthon cassette protein D [Blastochloris sp.]
MRVIRGFTLVELLVVIAIVAVIFALAVSALNNVGRSSALNGAKSTLSSYLEGARLKALTESRTVELRFYKIPGQSTADSAYQAMQLWDPLQDQPLDAVKILPTSVVMVEDPKFSSLLSNENPNGGKHTLAGVGQVDYKAFRIQSNGSTNLSTTGTSSDDAWFFSAKLKNTPEFADRPADNFVTFTVDPVNSRVSIFQP